MKTPLFSSLRKAMHMAIEANKQQITAEEIVQRAEHLALTRRKFLENTGKSLILGGIMPNFLLHTEGVAARSLSASMRIGAPRIAIIGGGIAGLSALHALKKGGYDATIYEASGRTSGRMFSVQGAMGEGTWTEFGGEFIDTNHADMHALAREFNLELMDCAQPSELALKQEAYFFHGRHYTLTEVVEAFKGLASKIKADAERLPDDVNYQTTDPFTRRIDRMSLSEYLDSIGARGFIKHLIEAAYEPEYGLSPQNQSAINLLLLISTDTSKDKIEWFGESDERYKVRGGNQSIPDALARLYPDNIQLNRSLEAISSRGTGYRLNFSGMRNAVDADFVVMAIPFTKLRQVDIRLRLPQVKWNSINHMGYGTNAKLMLGMNTHLWRAQGYTGLVYSDIGIPNGWDNAQLQTADNETAGLSILFGGARSIALAQGTPEHQRDIYLPKWERIYAGATAQHNGKIARMNWHSYKYNLGSYLCYRPGQYTSIGGAEVETVGHLYFAGEHCGGDFSGYMNGAAKSGREAGEGILASIGVGVGAR